MSVTVNPLNGFKSAVALSVSGLPSGVTASLLNTQALPGVESLIGLNASSTAAAGAATVVITGTSGTVSHKARFSLTVQSVVVATPDFRTRYTRTDSATEYPYEPNSRWMVFDAPTHRFFVSDPGGNRIQVLDASSESKIGSIVVPGAYGIDETPDHTVIYVGTQLGDIYTVDPVAMKVTHRYPSAQIGSGGFQAYEVRVLASGELALLGAQGGIPGVDGYGSVGVWNPVTNALAVYNKFSHIGQFTLTVDRSLIVLGDLLSPAGICNLDPATGNSTCSEIASDAFSIAPTPDGKSIVVTDGANQSVDVLDPRTFNETKTFPVQGSTSSDATMIVSPDSKTLYVGGAGLLYAYNLASGALVGWLPAVSMQPLSGGFNAGPGTGVNLQAFDNTGLLAGPMEEGAGFLDTTALKSGPAGSTFLNGYVVPATGPSGGGTSVQFENVANNASIGSAYFGPNPAPGVSQGGGEFYAVTPAGQPGPVDLYAVMADGGTLIVPEAFSYGPSILEVTPDSATEEGGGTGVVYGYGLGSTMDNAPIPTDLQITVGGRPAAITGYAPNAYNLLSPPFNLQAAAFTIPPGVSGSTADVTVTTSNGSGTAKAVFTYLPAVKQLPMGGSLAQGIYDRARDVYYFTNTSEIEVFSRSAGQWRTAIHVPPAPSGTTHRLWGIAISQDGTKLAISDTGTAMIYLIQPDTPGSAQSFPVSTYFAGSPISLSGIATTPAGLAVTNAGMIYFAAYITGGDGFDGFFKLDTTTGKVTDYGMDSFGGDQFRVAVSADNAEAFFNNEGDVFSVATATDTVKHASISPGCCYGDFDLALSPARTTVEATSYVYDTGMNPQAYLALNDREAMNVAYVNGIKFSSDGNLLFQPSTNGIDVFDGRVGTFLRRISLPFALCANYDALVSDGTDNILIGITGRGDGIAVIDLSSIPEPNPLSYAVSNGVREAGARASGVRVAGKFRQAHTQLPSSSGTPGRRVPVPVTKHQPGSAGSSHN